MVSCQRLNRNVRLKGTDVALTGIMLNPVSQSNLAESSLTSSQAKGRVERKQTVVAAAACFWAMDQRDECFDSLQTGSTVADKVQAFFDRSNNLLASRQSANRQPINPPGNQPLSSDLSASDLSGHEPLINNLLDRSSASHSRANHSRSKKAKRKTLPRNFFLKRLDARYWRRLFRYLYIRFLRIRSSPEAIARGIAAGLFAGSFPLLGIQSLIGITLAALVRGNKMVAVASTWISNPITFVPLFALNFHIGRWLLRLPTTTVLPPASTHLDQWMTMGLDVASAIMLGSVVVGTVLSIVGYYVGLVIAQRVRRAKAARRRR